MAFIRQHGTTRSRGLADQGCCGDATLEATERYAELDEVSTCKPRGLIRAHAVISDVVMGLM